MPTEPDVTSRVDGRRARRDRNRTAVLDAVLELFTEGNLAPSAEQVALRSGVSLRSVYRYVDNSDDLIRAAVERRREQVEPLFLIEGLGEGSLDERIHVLCATRVRAYDAVAPTARASRARAYSSAIVREQLDETSTLMRDQVQAQFANELDRLDDARRVAVLAALDVLCNLETLEHYRQRRGFSSEETIRLLCTSLGLLLGDEQ